MESFSMITKALTVVGRNKDRCGFRDSGAVECLENLPERRVRGRDFAVVGPPRIAGRKRLLGGYSKCGSK